MRRIFFPQKATLVVLAAAAVPVIVKSAKPLARKLGEGLQKTGRKIVEQIDDIQAKEATKAEQPSGEAPKTGRHKPQPTPTDEPKESTSATFTEVGPGDETLDAAASDVKKSAASTKRTANPDKPRPKTAASATLRQSKPKVKKATATKPKNVDAKKKGRRNGPDVETG